MEVGGSVELVFRVRGNDVALQIEYNHTNVIPVQTATAGAAYDFGDLGIDFFVRLKKTAVRTNIQLAWEKPISKIFC